MTEFKERTITVSIDDSVCGECATKACVTACRIYGSRDSDPERMGDRRSSSTLARRQEQALNVLRAS